MIADNRLGHTNGAGASGPHALKRPFRAGAGAGESRLAGPAGAEADASEIAPGSDLDDGTAGTPSGRERYAQPMLGPDEEVVGRAPSGKGEH